MSRPLSKTELIQAMVIEYQKLGALLKTLTEDQMCLPEVCGVWSVKDMLSHLYAWQQMVLSWYRAGVRGEDIKTPASDLKWSEIPIEEQVKAAVMRPHGRIILHLLLPRKEIPNPLKKLYWLMFPMTPMTLK